MDAGEEDEGDGGAVRTALTWESQSRSISRRFAEVGWQSPFSQCRYVASLTDRSFAICSWGTRAVAVASVAPLPVSSALDTGSTRETL